MPALALKSRPSAKCAFPTIAAASGAIVAAAVIGLCAHVFGRTTAAQVHALAGAMPGSREILLGACSGAAAGLLAGRIGIGGGIVADVVAGQLAAPHLPGSLMTGIFSVLCLVVAVRFAFPARFRPITEQPPAGTLRNLASVGIGLFSGLAGVGGGIMTNIVMTLSGMSMHKCVGRAAAVGVVVSVPATIVAVFGVGPHGATHLGSIDLGVWACVAPTQAATASVGALLAKHVAGDSLSRVMAMALLATGSMVLYSSLFGG